MPTSTSVETACGGADEFSAHDGVNAILEIYSLCWPNEIANGQTWYRTANRFARKVAAVTSKRTDTVAAVIARLSPRITWADNKAVALAVCAGTLAPDTKCYPDNIARAERIAEANNAATIAAEVLPIDGTQYKRPKISAFYRNIANPDNVGAVTVDTWAARIWLGDVDRTDLTVSEAESTRIQADYRQAASVAGLLPHEMQAVVWVGAHRLKKAKGQHSLFEVGLQFKI